MAAVAAPNESESDAVNKGIGVMVGLGGLALYGIPAGLGFSRVNGCRAARSERPTAHQLMKNPRSRSGFSSGA